MTMKDDDEAGSSRAKPKRVCININVDVVWALYRSRASARWEYVHLPSG
jgi:hypothetical protein